MKIVITGSSGFVGSHLLPLLQSEGHEVVGIGHQPPNLDAVGEYHELDLLDQEATRWFDFTKVDVVIHLAGLAAVGPSFDQPRRYIDANAGMQINLFESLIKQDVRPRVLVISTGTLCDARSLPITETSDIVTPNPYAVSKMTQEHLGNYYGRRGFEVIIARPFNHIGAGQAQGFIVADLAKQIAEAEASKSGTVSVGDLSSRRDYTDVRDIVKAYSRLIADGKPGQVYNVCSGTSHSGQEILDGLLAHTDCDIHAERDEARMRPSDTPEIYGSYDKLKQDTGWQPSVPLETTLKDVLDDWRRRIKDQL